MATSAADTQSRREWSAAVVALFGEVDDSAAFPLVERAIDKELASTTKEEQLWREESLMVDLVGEFVRAWSAKSVTRLAPIIKELIKEAKKKEDLMQGEGETRVMLLGAEKMLKAVLDGVEDSPRLLKLAIRHLYAGAKERFPGFQFRAVGALVGLRCYCPAIVSPDSYGLIKPGKEMHPVSRRILVKVAKLLQNVFNETGYEQDTTLPEAYQNFIRASIPKFHSVVFSITEGTQLSDSDSNNLPGSPGQFEMSSKLLSEGTKTIGRKSIFQSKKRGKTSRTSSLGITSSAGDASPELTSPSLGDPLSPVLSPRYQTPSQFVHFSPGERLDGTIGSVLEDEPLSSQRLTSVRSADDLHSASLLPRTRKQSFSSESLNSDEERDEEEGDEDELSGCSTGSSSTGGSGGEESTLSILSASQPVGTLKSLSRSASAAVDVLVAKRTKSATDNSAVRLFSSDSNLIFDPTEASCVIRMSCKELLSLLKRYGFSEDTRAAIKKAKVKGETLLKMDNVTLHALGVQKLGERKRLLKLVREANECNGFGFLDRLDIREWSSEEVAKWASVNGFGEYQQLFLTRGITGAQLARMNEHQQLSEIGISKWGHRQRMIKLIEEVRGFPSSPSPRPKGAATWTVDEVTNWLKAIEMDQYQSIFRTSHGAGIGLLQLDDAHLMWLGVSSLGHRKRLLRNIALLSAQLATNEVSEC